MRIEKNWFLEASLCQKFIYLQYLSLIRPRLPEQKAPYSWDMKNTETRYAYTVSCILRAFECGQEILKSIQKVICNFREENNHKQIKILGQLAFRLKQKKEKNTHTFWFMWKKIRLKIWSQSRPAYFLTSSLNDMFNNSSVQNIFDHIVN